MQFHLFSRFIRFIFPYRLKWIIILILSGLGSLLSLINPYLTKLVIDKAIGKRDLKIFILLALIGGVVFIVIGVINSFKQYLERYIKVKIKFDLNREVFRHIQRLPLRWFQERSTGEQLYKFSYDVDRVRDFITIVPPHAIALFPKLLLILFIIFKLNWQLSIFTLCLTPLLYITPYYFIKNRRSAWERLIKSSQGIFKVLQEFFSHIYPVKAFGREGHERRRYLRKLVDNIRIELNSIRLEVFNSFFAQVADKIIIGLITFYGGYQVIKGTMTLGTLTAILVYLGQLVGMQSHFIMFFQTTVLGLVSCQRVAEVLDQQGRVEEDKKRRGIKVEKGEIIFDRITFGYLPDKPIVRDLSFAIEGGKHIALVGRSGSGKTTLLNLILRLYEVWRGRILIDGIDVKAIDTDRLRRHIGIALQEPFLFNDTVRGNILFGKDDAKEKDVIEASRISLSHEFILNLPEGYDTIIGENACKISEGQKQKIAIARALIKNPKILILDEAMSSMDSAGEEKIISNIKEDFKDTTIITVSHRLSSVITADLVYFLKAPDRIVTGTFEDLTNSDNEFYDLFKAQLRDESIYSERGEFYYD